MPVATGGLRGFRSRPYRVRPQGGDELGQRQLPQLLHVRPVDQTLGGVKDVVLYHEEAGRGERHDN